MYCPLTIQEEKIGELCDIMALLQFSWKGRIEKDFTYHSSRHTTATLAITAGADISAVKEMLGHGSVTSTEVYARVSLDKKIQAVSLTDGVFE